MLTLSDLKLDATLPTEISRLTIPQAKEGELFLRGPIPWTWLGKAASAQRRGKCVHVALVLWLQCGLAKSPRVHVQPSLLRALGVERTAAYRALEAMEKKGIVKVERHRGRSPTVTLLDV